MIIVSDTFIPTHVDDSGRTYSIAKAEPIIIPNPDPILPDRVVPQFTISPSDEAAYTHANIPVGARPIKQFGGCGFGAGLNVDTWARENAERPGVVVVIRQSHGELYQ